ncbi:HD domain-containing protein [Vibrio fluminensis]|uniref:HD domain-containing protein n=1 Tax=Vibrio fluminensis TaxID=2783614 RepID=UPI0018871019|nr:HD domain-containing protein [Vibrio fluminensis]
MAIDYAHLEQQLVQFVKDEMVQDSAHDLAHIQRVVKTAKQLCSLEGANLAIVLPAAYLHDCVVVAKHHPDRAKSSLFAADKAIELLRSIHYPEVLLNDIHHAIVAHSFSAQVEPNTLEAKIVQDADRLDALGAIGVIRCIQVSTSLGVELYQAENPFCHNRQPDDRQFTIDHFYTKLFKLKETMRTESARVEAEKRTEFMQGFLEQLGREI